MNDLTVLFQQSCSIDNDMQTSTSGLSEWDKLQNLLSEVRKACDACEKGNFTPQWYTQNLTLLLKKVHTTNLYYQQEIDLDPTHYHQYLFSNIKKIYYGLLELEQTLGSKLAQPLLFVQDYLFFLRKEEEILSLILDTIDLKEQILDAIDSEG